jgi:hypothetical protein
MNYRIRIIALTIVAMVSFSGQLNAGFQDHLKNTMKALGGGNGLTNDEIVNGLKEALEVGTGNAVQTVAQTDGYFSNPQIKIPLPENVQTVEKLLRATGFAGQVDAFELSMNRAAERAAPEARSIFGDAIRQMTFTDAREILDGPDDAATSYFQSKTTERLQALFKPITHQAMSEVGVTRNYQTLDAKIKTIPLADQSGFDLDQYVTDKALDGLFLMLAEEERKIRQDPAARVTDLLQKVFERQ